MVTLFEKYRPRTFADVAGQGKAVGVLESMAARGGFGGRALWISGPSGSGKTTLARIIAGSVADDWLTQEYDAADQFGAAECDRLADSMRLFASGKGGRAWIVNEAHGLRAPVIRVLLGILERLPAHCVVIFTTTRDGQEALFDGIDSHPLLSRCVPVTLTNQGLAQPFAERLLAIARAEGLADDSTTVADALKVVRAHKSNMRAALNAVESGALLRAELALAV